MTALLKPPPIVPQVPLKLFVFSVPPAMVEYCAPLLFKEPPATVE